MSWRRNVRLNSRRLPISLFVPSSPSRQPFSWRKFVEKRARFFFRRTTHAQKNKLRAQILAGLASFPSHWSAWKSRDSKPWLGLAPAKRNVMFFSPFSTGPERRDKLIILVFFPRRGLLTWMISCLCTFRQRWRARLPEYVRVSVCLSLIGRNVRKFVNNQWHFYPKLVFFISKNNFGFLLP